MRCIAHISDLHFGTEEPALVEGLLADLAAHAPSFIIVSGDLTQRARTSQYRAACRFLERLQAPYLVVPGNHDVPLFDILRRFLSPLGRYKRFISPVLDPFYEDAEFAIAGINTARSLTWKSGRISCDQIDCIREKLGRVSQDKFKIVVTHHPFIPPPGEPESGIDLVGRAAEALVALDEVGVDLLLAGHLHLGYSGDVRTYYPGAHRSIIVVQAGTAISRRVRSQPNAYNLLRLRRETIVVTPRVWKEAAFQAEQDVRYDLDGSEWRLAAAS